MALSIWDVAWTQVLARHKALIVSLRERKGQNKCFSQMRTAIVTARVALKTLGQTITPTDAKWESQSLKDLYERLEILKWRVKDFQQAGAAQKGVITQAYLRYLGVLTDVRKRVEQCKYEINKREAALPDLPVADLDTVKGQATVQAKLFREQLLREVTEPAVRSQLAFEKSLQLGEKVQVRWPWGRDTYTASGTLSKVSGQSFTVTLDQPVLLEGCSWPKGHEITVPRLSGMARRWSPQNGIFPV
jgi:hypothetical protein